MSYTEKFFTAIPLIGPGAQHFLGLACILSGHMGIESLNRLTPDVRAAILEDLVELSSDPNPSDFLLSANEDARTQTLLFGQSGSPLASAQLALFEYPERAMEDYQDEQAFGVIRHGDDIYITHVDGYSFSENISALLSTSLARYAPDEIVVVRYSMDGESLETSAFGGGAVAISKDGSRSFSSRDAADFAALMLTGSGKTSESATYENSRSLVVHLLDGMTPQEQRHQLGTLAHAIKDLQELVAERLEHQRDMDDSSYAPG